MRLFESGRFAAVTVVVYLLLSPGTSHALSGFSAVVNGQTQTISGGATEYNLSGSQGESTDYGCLRIEGPSPGSGAAAKIKTLETPDDKLWLENAVMKTAPGYTTCTATVSFWATFSSPPSTSGGGIKYERVAGGTLSRNAGSALGAWFQVEGWIDGNTINGWQKKTVTCLDAPDSTKPCSGWISLTRDSLPNYTAGTLPDPREIKITFTVYLKTSNDKLNVLNSNTQDIHVMSLPYGGGAKGTDGASDPSVTSGTGSPDDKSCNCCCPPCKDQGGTKHPKDDKGTKKKHN
jgi:hypothetical protein